jgi:hypothetical protein
MADNYCVESKTLRGTILLVVGILLLLHSFGLFRSLNLLIIIGSIALIVYGAVLANIPQHIQKWFKK